MKKNILYLSFILGLVGVFSACEDNKTQFLSDYSTIFYFLNSGEQPLTIYKTGEDSKIPVIVNKGGSDLSSTGDISVRMLDAGQLAIYNAEHDTDYELLPAEVFQLPSSMNASFGSKDLYLGIEVTYKTDLIWDLPSDKNYVLPLSLSSTDSVNVEKQLVFIKPSVELPYVSFSTSGYFPNFFSDEGATEVTLNLPVALNAPNKWAFDCTVAIDEQLLNEYNAENGVSYALLPTDAYTMSGAGKVSFTPNDQEVKLTMVVDRTKLSYGNYVLPLRLESCSKDGFFIDMTKNICLFGVSYTPKAEDLLPVGLTASMLASNAVEPSEGSLANLLDANTATYFHSAWSVTVDEPHYLQINLQNPLVAFSFNYIGRATGGNGNPAAIELWTSENGITFGKIGTIADENLPTGALAAYSSPIFVTKPAKAIRLVVPKNKANTLFFVFSEFGLKGVEQ